MQTKIQPSSQCPVDANGQLPSELSDALVGLREASEETA